MQTPLLGCHRKTAVGTLFLTFFHKLIKMLYVLTIWRFFVPKFVDINAGLLELFENVVGVRLYEKQRSV